MLYGCAPQSLGVSQAAAAADTRALRPPAILAQQLQQSSCPLLLLPGWRGGSLDERRGPSHSKAMEGQSSESLMPCPGLFLPPPCSLSAA